MAQFKVTFNFIHDMGSVMPIIATGSPMETVEENALWQLNNMREHDGLSPLKRLPNGCKISRIES